MERSQLRVILGAALLRKVQQMAIDDVRPITYQIAWLCRLALRAPVEPPRAPPWDLGDDPPRSGMASMAVGVVPDVLEKIIERIGRTKESKSQVVRQLVRSAIAIEDWRTGMMEKASRGKSSRTKKNKEGG